MKKNKDEEVYMLTPKYIFELSLVDAGLADGIEDRAISVAWELFEARMMRNGYVQDEESKK